MIQVSGIRFRYDPAREKGRRVANIEPSEGKWELDQLYLVVTNSMLAKGGHNQHTFSQGKELKEHGSQYEAIKLWITP